MPSDLIEHIRIPSTDDYPLAASVYGEGDEQLVIINSATAVSRRFYRYYAAALADAGFRVITFDYRGIGESRPDSLRGFTVRSRDWVFGDMAGVLRFARRAYKPSKLFLIGHSIGGQLAGLLEDADAIDGMITMSAQSGHWRLQGAEQKWVVALHVHVTLPLAAHLFGYVPWSRMGSAEDLPKGVALDWSRWCRDRKYVLGDDSLPLERYASFRAPVLAYSIDDDKWGTRPAVEAMMQAYPNLRRRHIVPAEHGFEQLGHFGYFRKSASALWQDGIDWLRER
ncbi:MAG: alpha/beta fold hydrolase [Pseudomonadota bacterium]